MAALLNKPNGTGPYKLTWDIGQRMDLAANTNYWGTKALTPKLEFQWNNDGAAKLPGALQRRRSTASTTPARTTCRPSRPTQPASSTPARALNTMYFGMNNTYKPWNNVKVRQAIAMGIDRQRIVDNFFPPGTEVADYFTPCCVPFACEGAKAPHSTRPRPRRCSLEGLGEEGIDIATLDIPISYRAARPRLRQRPARRRPGRSSPSSRTNLGHHRHTPTSTRTRPTSASPTPASWTACSSSAGACDFPDASNFLTYHFGSGAGVKFGNLYPDLVEAITKGDQSVADADRAAAYSQGQRPHRPACPGRHRVPCGLRDRLEGRRRGRPLLAPVDRDFSVMKAGDRDILVFMQGGQPGEPVLRRRDRWRDPAGLRADQGVAVRLRGRWVST